MTFASSEWALSFVAISDHTRLVFLRDGGPSAIFHGYGGIFIWDKWNRWIIIAYLLETMSLIVNNAGSPMACRVGIPFIQIFRMKGRLIMDTVIGVSCQNLETKVKRSVNIQGQLMIDLGQRIFNPTKSVRIMIRHLVQCSYRQLEN